ncbi:MAG TPA: hypothetical protein VIK91_19875 [Nannocystis sp.]
MSFLHAGCGTTGASLERLHDVSTTQVEPREPWGLAGLHGRREFVSNYAEFGEFASAIKGLEKSVCYCFEQ